MLQKGSGSLFDPDMIEVISEIEEDFRQTALRSADSEKKPKTMARMVLTFNPTIAYY